MSGEGTSEGALAIGVPPDPSGPVFIGYGWSDSAELAKGVARQLRACGVPVSGLDLR
jgi:hypothetical protein